jgi:hypothetical protein
MHCVAVVRLGLMCLPWGEVHLVGLSVWLSAIAVLMTRHASSLLC